jgi:hypothetical protein
LLLGVLALALVGVLALYRDAMGGLTERTATSVARQAGRGYGSMGASIRTASADDGPSVPGPEDDPAPPDSAGSAAAAGSSGLPSLATP